MLGIYKFQTISNFKIAYEKIKQSIKGTNETS